VSEQLVTLRAQLAEQSSTLLGQHPRIKECAPRLADLESQMRMEADRLARSLGTTPSFEREGDGLSSGMDQLNAGSPRPTRQDVQLRALERDQVAARPARVLSGQVSRGHRTHSIGAASPARASSRRADVFQYAVVAKKLPTILVSALAMLVLSSGFILSSEC